MFECLRIWRYRHLILHKAYADFRAESERTYLGVIWWVLDPLITLLIFYLVFGVILNRGRADFVPFLIVGITLWLWLSNTVSVSCRTILQNVSLVRQISFNKSIFPFSSILTCVFKFSFSLIVMFVILWALGYRPHASWAAFPVLLGVEFLFLLGVTFPLCAIIPFVPDLAKLVNYMLRLVFYMSGIFFAISDISSPKLQRILYLNPMAHLIEFARDSLMYNRFPNWEILVWISLFSVVSTYLGLWLIWRFDAVYAKRIV